MTRLDKLATVWMGRRLESVRQGKRLSVPDVAARMGMRQDAYRKRELGRIPVTLSFLLRAQLAMDVRIDLLWFPLRKGIGVPDESTTEEAFSDLLRQESPVTIEQVLEVAADVFQVPVSAVMSGLGHKRLRQARTAAALAVESIPHLHLADLSRLVSRTPSALNWSRRQAQRKAGKGFWKKVAAIRSEVESL